MSELNESQPVERSLEQEKMGGEFEVSLSRYDQRLGQVYKKALERSREEEAMVFGLVEIPTGFREERLDNLKGKLDEYTDRLRTQWGDNRYLPFELLSTDGRYKRDILGIVLKEGSVNTWALSRAYEEMGNINGNRFENACGVIHEYIKSGGVGLVGGTGLSRTASKP